MKITLLMVLFSISYMIGSVIGLKESGNRINDIDDSSSGDSFVKKDDLKLAFNKVLKTDFKRTLLQDEKFSNLESLTSRVDYLFKESESNDFNQYFDDDGEIGLYFKRIIIADSYREVLFTNDEVDKMTKEYQEFMLKHPEETFSSIKEFVTEGGSDRYPLQTLGLITFAGRLSKVNDDVKELAYEITTKSVNVPDARITGHKTERELNIALSTNVEIMVPIVAYSIYIEKETQPILGIERTIDAISSQKSELIRSRIFADFVLKFPTYKDRLKDQLKDRGILM